MRCVADGVAVKNSIYLPSGVYGVWAVAGAVAWRPDGAMGPNELGIYGVGMGVGAMAVDVGCVCLRSYLPRRLSGRSAKAPPLMDASTSKV